MSIFDTSINTLGNSKGNSKSKIEPDIYEAVIIGIADAGTSVKSWQGKDRTVQNVVLVMQLDHVNGFGSTSVVTDWVVPSGHDQSNFRKNFIDAAKLKINSLGDLVGAKIRVEIEDNADGFARVVRYFASKKPIDIADGMYMPKWIIDKQYPIRKDAKVLDGVRPVADKPAPTAAPVSAQVDDTDLPW